MHAGRSGVTTSSVSDAQVHTWLGVLEFGVADLVEKPFRDVHVERRAHPDDWRMWRLRAGTPGLAAEEGQRACDEMGKLAPDDLEDAELSPCSRD